ncbi:alcohol dehydrogenase catalytic domain-containing protein [Dorea sp. D27]|uniref:alcohol dehydrogenase catalytic domain-containing protein n=1 Tax=Dorea sp. D27 TaxID=658665 RepID=UPI0006732E43|nr:alcohol dehydrogenase catalytic domain-containing protein [Dorea sp. D27]KMZ53613.1 putative zinc-binding sorbitol dehydrogenase [Dorea sp. D27]
MKAYVMDESRNMKVQDMPEPIATENNAIIQIKYASICGTDFRTFMKGNEKITPPRILGHESVGVLTHAGAYAKAYGLMEGDRVTVAPAVGCGQCWPCQTGHTNMCDHLETVGFQYEGAFAEKMEVPKQAIKMGNVIKVPDNVPDMSAVLAEPTACARNAQQYLNIQPEDTVVIYGSGYIGCIHAELARLAGATKIIMVEIAEVRAKIAKKMIPGIIMINPKEQNTVKEVERITGGRGANVVITALSVPSVHTEAQVIASKMGRISLFGGLAGDGKGYIDSNLIHYKELSVHGVHATTPAMMRQILAYVEEGRLDLEKYVSEVCKLEDIQNGFVSIRDNNALKVLVKP